MWSGPPRRQYHRGSKASRQRPLMSGRERPPGMSALRENTLAALQAPGVEGDLVRVGGRIRQHMKTFDELKAVLAKKLLEIEQLAGIWPSTIEKRHVKEQEIGQL